MWSVWRTVLEENEKLSKARLAAIEVFLQQIADDAKILRMQKLQTTKRVRNFILTYADIEMLTRQLFNYDYSLYFRCCSV